MENKKLGYVYIIIAAILWGFSGSCGQYLLAEKQMNSLLLVFLRLFVSGVFMMAYVLMTKKDQLKEMFKDKKDVKDLVICSILGTAMCQFTYIVAIKYSNAGTATVMQYLGPIFVVIVVAVQNGKMPSVREVGCVLTAMVGVFLLSTHGNISSMEMTHKGFFWGIMAGLGLMLNTILPLRLIKKYSSFMYNAVAMLIGGIFVLVAFRPLKYFEPLDLGGYLGLVGIIFIGTVAAVTLFFKGMMILGPVKGSMLASLETVASVIITHFWLKTQFQIMDIIGFSVIILAVLVLSSEDLKKSKPTSAKEESF